MNLVACSYGYINITELIYKRLGHGMCTDVRLSGVTFIIKSGLNVIIYLYKVHKLYSSISIDIGTTLQASVIHTFLHTYIDTYIQSVTECKRLYPRYSSQYPAYIDMSTRINKQLTKYVVAESNFLCMYRNKTVNHSFSL